MIPESLISIVMPVRNAAPYLRDCLDSILEQSYSRWELIAVNDNSDDDSLQVLREYSELDDRIKALSLEHGKRGIIDALQLAYHNSNGSYITRMDADDLMSQDKISQMSSRLRSKGLGYVAVGYVSYFSKNGVGDGYLRYADWLNSITKTGSNFTEIYKECVVPSPCWMMARVDLEKIGGFESDVYPEDYDLCFRMRQHKLQITGIEEVLHYWRDHENRASRNDPNYKDNRFLSLKIFYFLYEDLNTKSTLVLWGAGKKGKDVAKKLIRKSVPFKWVTNNPRKIGHDIYGQVLASDSDIHNLLNLQVIITIAKPHDKVEVVDRLEAMGLQSGVDYFAFC